MTFRRPTPSDLPILNHISYTSKSYWGYPKEWLERWAPDLKLSSEQLDKHSVLVAETEKAIIGFCVVDEDANYYEVLHLWVLPEFIGRGYGKRLLQQALDSFTKADKPIRVEADPNAEAFYARQGFITFDQVESYPPGRFLPVMRKDARTS